MATLKRAVRRMLRPFLQPILRRLDEVRHIAVELDRALPLVRNSIESQNAELRAAARYRAGVRAELDGIHDDLRRAQLHIAALRDELALALSGSAPVASAPPDAAVDGSGALRLSFGGDERSTPGYTAVDLGDLSGERLAADLRGLAFGERSAAEIRAARILERFSPADLRDVVLPYWRGLLRPGGDLVAAGVPTESLEGLLRLLEDVGFDSIETVSRWHGGVAEVVEVRARPAGRVSAPVEVRSRNSEVHAR